MAKAKYRYLKIGQRFGSWVIYKQDYCSKSRKITCRCDCGTIKPVAAKDLDQGKTTRCSECTRRYPRVRKGDIFGKWIAITDELQSRARFRCDCDYQTGLVKVSDMRSGKSTQCKKCYRKYSQIKKGDRFFLWEAMEDEPPVRDHQSRVLCRCKCGKIRSVRVVDLLYPKNGRKHASGGCKSCRRKEHGMSKTREYRRVSAAAYRALKRDAPGDCTIEQWVARSAYYGDRCIYCGATEDMAIDHRIPLCRGGSNWPSNLVPVCRSCNSSKRAKTEKEFKEWLKTKSKNI